MHYNRTMLEQALSLLSAQTCSFQVLLIILSSCMMLGHRAAVLLLWTTDLQWKVSLSILEILYLFQLVSCSLSFCSHFLIISL